MKKQTMVMRMDAQTFRHAENYVRNMLLEAAKLYPGVEIPNGASIQEIQELLGAQLIVSDDNCTVDGCEEQRMVFTQDGQKLCLEHAEQGGYCPRCGSKNVEDGTSRLEYLQVMGFCRDCWDDIKK